MPTLSTSPEPLKQTEAIPCVPAPSALRNQMPSLKARSDVSGSPSSSATEKTFRKIPPSSIFFITMRTLVQASASTSVSNTSFVRTSAPLSRYAW